MAKNFNKIVLSNSMSELYEDKPILEVKDIDLISHNKVNGSTKSVKLTEIVHRKLKQNSLDTGMSIFDLCNIYIENGVRESEKIRSSKG